jgi:uncharacterized iron-regulated membrane protein
MGSRSELRQRLWRWHFFAGLMVCPFAILLSITGAIYLFKPQIDSYEENRINARAPVVEAHISPMPADQLVRGLLLDQPQAHLKHFILAKKNDRTVEVVLNQANGQEEIFWVDRYTGQVLNSAISDRRFLAVVKKLHGELLLGSKGSYVVELMASWMIVLMLTGLYLWVAKSGYRGSASINWRRWFIPRLGSRRAQSNYRSLHGVLGMWFVIPILLLLLSGLPWTQLWGSGFKKVQDKMGWGQSWGQQTQISASSSSLQQTGAAITDSSLWEINSSVTPKRDEADDTSADHYADMATLETIVQRLAEEDLYPPVQIQPPDAVQEGWMVRTLPQQRSERVTIHYDRYSAEELMRMEFDDYHFVQRLTSQGISLHEGALFGWLNQLLGLLTAIAIIGLSSFGLAIWWLRRPTGKLAAPPKVTSPLSVPLCFSILAIGLFLPAAGLSFVVVAILEYVYSCFKSKVNLSAVSRRWCNLRS